MANLQVNKRELITLLEEELREYTKNHNESLIKDLIKIVTKDLKQWGGNIGTGVELRNLYKALNDCEF